MFRLSTSALFAVATMGLLGSGLAQAQDATTTSQMVAAGDLNLTTPAGASTLRHRIALAARNVCGPSETMGAPEYSIYEHCVTDAQRQAAAKAEAMIAAVRTGNRFALATPGN